jgi:hypothetical protein
VFGVQGLGFSLKFRVYLEEGLGLRFRVWV